jgi:hypothetical protein
MLERCELAAVLTCRELREAVAESAIQLRGEGKGEAKRTRILTSLKAAPPSYCSGGSRVAPVCASPSPWPLRREASWTS